MAAPVIHSIQPAEGPAAGRTLVCILASNLKPQEPAAPGTFIPPPLTTRVLFGDAEASDVQVFNKSKLTCITPPAKPGAVDVQVINLDPDEPATAAAGFEYKRPDLMAVTEIDHVSEALRGRFSDQVLENTLLSQDSDYDGFPQDMLDRAQTATLPSIVLAGPRMPVNLFFSEYTRRQEALAAGEALIKRPAYTVDLRFDVFVFARTRKQQLALAVALMANINKRRILDVAQNSEDPAAGTVEFDLDFEGGGELRAIQRPNISNLSSLAGEIVVRGVRIENEPGFPDDLAVERSRKITDINLRIIRP